MAAFDQSRSRDAGAVCGGLWNSWCHPHLAVCATRNNGLQPSGPAAALMFGLMFAMPIAALIRDWSHRRE